MPREDASGSAFRRKSRRRGGATLGFVPRRADLLWTALAIAVALAVLQLGTSDPSQGDRGPDLLGALLAVAACAPVAVRRAHPVAAAVVALPFAGAALALGYLVIPPVLVALMLCSGAVLLSARRVTVPLAAYAGTVMAAAVGSPATRARCRCGSSVVSRSASRRR